MNEVRGPGEMDFTSPQNLSETWRRWKRGMEYYLTAICTDKTEAQKVAIFMCMIGKDGQEIKDTFEFETRENGQEVITTAILFDKFEAHCKHIYSLEMGSSQTHPSSKRFLKCQPRKINMAFNDCWEW